MVANDISERDCVQCSQGLHYGPFRNSIVHVKSISHDVISVCGWAGGSSRGGGGGNGVILEAVMNLTRVPYDTSFKRNVLFK